MPDTAATDEDVPIVIPVLANDSDPDGDLDLATLAVTSAAGQGTFTVVGWEIEYTPAADVSGADSFDYEICDVGGRCSTAAVTVTIAPVNDPPAAVDDAAAGLPRTVIVIDVLSNDSDIDGGPLTISGSDPISALGGSVACGTQCVYTPPDPWTGLGTFSYVVKRYRRRRCRRCDRDGDPDDTRHRTLLAQRRCRRSDLHSGVASLDRGRPHQRDTAQLRHQS